MTKAEKATQAERLRLIAARLGSLATALDGNVACEAIVGALSNEQRQLANSLADVAQSVSSEYFDAIEG